MEVFCRLLEHYLTEGSGDPLRDIRHRATRQAAHQQMAIGLQFMPRGYLAKGWFTAISDTGCSQIPNDDLGATELWAAAALLMAIVGSTSKLNLHC